MFFEKYYELWSWKAGLWKFIGWFKGHELKEQFSTYKNIQLHVGPIEEIYN